MTKNIFVQKDIVCPACQNAFPVKYPNPKLYAAVSRDEDQRVTAYSWTMGIQTDILPHHYSVLQCPHCFLADFYERLEKPLLDRKSREIIQRVQKMTPSQRLILQKLRQGVKEGGMDVTGAIMVHLAALFCTLSSGDEKWIDHLRLGRLCLRLSWLYRERPPSLSAAANGNNEPQADVMRISAPLARIAELGEEMEEALDDVLERAENLKKETVKRTLELNLPPAKNPYAARMAALEEYLGNALQELGKLEETAARDKKNILIIRDAATANSPGADAENPESILEGVKQLWPQLPGDESACLTQAAEALDYSFRHEAGDQNMQQNLGLGALLLHLLAKTGRLEKALDYSALLYRTCFKDKQSLQGQLAAVKKDGELSDEEIKEMNRTLTTVINTLNKAAESRKTLLEQLYVRDREKIAAILRPLAGAPVKEQLLALTAAGVHEALAQSLAEKMTAQDPTRKKKP